MSTLALRHINKSFDGTQVLHDINLEIDEGEFVVFVGPSGCGKSTLLRLIAGLESIDTGTLDMGGQCVNALSPRQRRIAMVFQSYALYPHMSVFNNMAFGLKIDGLDKAQIRQRILQTAEKLQLQDLLTRKPGQLSGGQRQRVAIGRAIVRDPKVFLFDEPLSNLDAALRVQMRMEIAKLQKSLDTTTVYVTHDQVEAMTLADKIVVLNAGVVEQVGEPLTLYHQPKNLFVAGFIGSPKMNFLGAEIHQQGMVEIPKQASQTLPQLPHYPSGAVTLGVRPEHLSLSPCAGLKLTGRVESLERLGDVTYLYVNIDSDALLNVTLVGDVALDLGSTITLYAASGKVHVFDSEGDAITRAPQT